MNKFLFLALSCVVFAAGCKSDGDGGTTADATTTAGGSTGKPDTSNTALVVTYANIKSILDTKCIGCHGDKGKDGIDLRTYEAIMKGGKGPIVVPGDPAGSDIVKVLHGTDGKPMMPFKQPPLSKDEINQIEEWVKGGAKA